MEMSKLTQAGNHSLKEVQVADAGAEISTAGQSAASSKLEHVFPSYARFDISLVKGKGSWVWDDKGNKYLDFTCGLAVTSLGHAPEKVGEKLKAQIDTLWHVSNLFHIPGQDKVAELLTANSCADQVFFCNSGAESNEAAIKLARRYHQKVKGTGRYEVITFEQSFHGRTLATLTATGQQKVKTASCRCRRALSRCLSMIFLRSKRPSGKIQLLLCWRWCWRKAACLRCSRSS